MNELSSAPQRPRASIAQDLYHRAHLLSIGGIFGRSALALTFGILFGISAASIWLTVNQELRMYGPLNAAQLVRIPAAEWLAIAIAGVVLGALLIAPLAVAVRCALVLGAGALVRFLRGRRALQAAIRAGRRKAMSDPFAPAEARRELALGWLALSYLLAAYVGGLATIIVGAGKTPVPALTVPLAAVAGIFTVPVVIKIAASFPGCDVVVLSRAYFSLHAPRRAEAETRPVPACVVCNGARIERARWRRLLKSLRGALTAAFSGAVRWAVARSAWAAYVVEHRVTVVPLLFGLAWALLLELGRMSVLQAVSMTTYLAALMVGYGVLRGRSRTIYDALFNMNTRQALRMAAGLAVMLLLIFNVRLVTRVVGALGQAAHVVGLGYDETQAVFLVFFTEGLVAMLLWRTAMRLIGRTGVLTGGAAALARGAALPVCALLAGTFEAGFAVLLIIAAAGWLAGASKHWRDTHARGRSRSLGQEAP